MKNLWDTSVSQNKRTSVLPATKRTHFSGKVQTESFWNVVKTAIAISSSHLPYTFLNKSKYSQRICSDFIFGRALKILRKASALLWSAWIFTPSHISRYMNIYFSFKSVRFTKISFSWGYVKNRRRKDSLCKFRILNEIWSLILKRYLQNAFKDHKKLFLAVFLRSVNFSAAPVDSAFKLWRLKYDESDYSMINYKW